MANEQDFAEALFFRSQETEGGPMDLLPADWPEFYAGFFRPIRSQYSQSCLKPSPIKLNQRFLFVADIVSPHCRFIHQSDSRLKGILCPLPKTKIEVPDKNMIIFINDCKYYGNCNSLMQAISITKTKTKPK